MLITATASSTSPPTAMQVLSGHTPREIAQADIYFIEAIGLQSHLSPTRANGLLAMLRQIRNYAIAFQAQTLQQ
jgi:cysteine desulfuration protein SufE